jgi:cysteine desulfurase / selenocysteine lyase
VLGTALDVAPLCDLAHRAGALCLVDVAQAAGHRPLDAGDADMLAFTGHKGMLGPPGIGGLWVRPGLHVEPLVTGGTGGDSSRREMPDALPDRLEAGTLNGAGIAGLLAGVEHVLQEGVPALHQRLARLKLQLHARLAAIPGIRVLSPPAADGVPIVTIAGDTLDTATFASRLDREHGVLVRAGLHCAPEAHRILGTLDSGGVRFSLGWSSSAADVEHAVAAVAALAAGPVADGANRVAH